MLDTQEIKESVEPAEEDQEIKRRINDAFVKVLARRESIRDNLIQKKMKNKLSLMSLIKKAYALLGLSSDKSQIGASSKVAPSDLVNIFVAADKNDSGRIEKEEVMGFVQQLDIENSIQNSNDMSTNIEF